MPAKKKITKKSVKMRDLKPSKDARGGNIRIGFGGDENKRNVRVGDGR